MTKAARQQEEAIKQKIVDGCKRGVCTHDGGYIPPEHRGGAGTGSHFHFIGDRKAYAESWERVHENTQKEAARG